MCSYSDNDIRYAIEMLTKYNSGDMSFDEMLHAAEELLIKEVGGVFILNNELCDAIRAYPDLIKCAPPSMFGRCCYDKTDPACSQCRSVPVQQCLYQPWISYFLSYVI